MQIQEISGLLGGVITLTMIAIASARQRLQQAAMHLGPEMASEVILAI